MVASQFSGGFNAIICCFSSIYFTQEFFTLLVCQFTVTQAQSILQYLVVSHGLSFENIQTLNSERFQHYCIVNELLFLLFDVFSSIYDICLQFTIWLSLNSSHHSSVGSQKKKSLISQLFVIFPATKKTEGKSTKLRARYLFHNISKCVCCVLACGQKHTISSNVLCLLGVKVGNCFLGHQWLSIFRFVLIFL